MSAAVSKDPAAPGLVITIQPGKAGYPGIISSPRERHGTSRPSATSRPAWSTRVPRRFSSPCGWITRAIGTILPGTREQIYLKPGERGTVTVIFGHSYGHKPAYALNPKEVVNILMFTGKVDAVTSFRIESLVAGGPAGEKPPVDPASVRIQPKNGFLLGPGVTIDAKTQIEAKGAKVVGAPPMGSRSRSSFRTPRASSRWP